METTIPKIISQSNKNTLREVVAEIITNEHAYSVDGIPQFDGLHTAMIHAQDSILKYVLTNWSLNKEEIDDISFRCKQISKYLDLISDASLQNRYMDLPDVLDK